MQASCLLQQERLSDICLLPPTGTSDSMCESPLPSTIQFQDGVDASAGDQSRLNDSTEFLSAVLGGLSLGHNQSELPRTDACPLESFPQISGSNGRRKNPGIARPKPRGRPTSIPPAEHMQSKASSASECQALSGSPPIFKRITPCHRHNHQDMRFKGLNILMVTECELQRFTLQAWRTRKNVALGTHGYFALTIHTSLCELKYSELCIICLVQQVHRQKF